MRIHSYWLLRVYSDIKRKRKKTNARKKKKKKKNPDPSLSPPSLFLARLRSSPVGRLRFFPPSAVTSAAPLLPSAGVLPLACLCRSDPLHSGFLLPAEWPQRLGALLIVHLSLPMWNNGKQNMMVPGQGTNYDIAFDMPIPTEELRKRKAMDFDFHSSFYAGHLSNRESYLQQGVIAPQETNSHLRATEEFPAYKLQPATKAFNALSQTGNSQFCNLSNLPTIMQTQGSNTPEGAIGGFNSITFNEKGSSFSSMMFSAGIANQVQCLNSDTISYGRDHANYGMPIKLHQFSATQCLNNDAISCGNYDSNNISVDHFNIRYREQSHTIIQKTVSSKPINNEQLSLSCERVENIGQSSMNSFTETSEKNSSESKDAYSSEEMVTKQVEIGNKLPSQNEPTKLAADQLSPIITEKLWDGSLQLNTSTMVSALAFFKSGEKTQGIKWPKLVEIKGKVRLQAFEKFIQELPRSRNRSLMVISLCWKVGSSNSGLTGMKEVANGYRQSEKVGFAHICSGYDLYVCPRSDKIITILAKHGFFKGIMAVEEDQDSMIGCVIWRRSHQSSNTGPKTSDAIKNSSEKLLLSDEPSAVAVKCPLAESTPCSRESEGAPSKILAEGTNSMRTESMLIQSTKSLSNTSSSKENIIERNCTNSIVPTLEVRKPNTSSGTSLVPSQPAQLFSLELNKQVALPGPPPFPPDVLQRVIHSCIAEKKEPTNIPLNVPRPLVLQTKEAPHCPDDDDDLPEFDFSDACGVQVKNLVSNLPPPLNRQLQVEKANMSGFAPPEARKRKLGNVLDSAPPTSSFRAESLNTHERISMPAKYGNYALENGPDSIRAIANQSLQRKSSWNDNSVDDDDDDMPEWCPPESEQINQLQPSIPNKVPFDVTNGAPHPMYSPLPRKPLSPSKSLDYLPQHQRGILGPHPSIPESPERPDESPPPGFAHLSRRPPPLHERSRSSRHLTSRPDIKPRRSGPFGNRRSSKGR